MEGSPKDLFKVWHLIYNKDYNYNTHEGVQKYKTFKNNLSKIKEHNAKGEEEYTMGLHHLSDLTYEEFSQYYKLKPMKPKQLKRFLASKFINFDDYEDEETTQVVKQDNTADLTDVLFDPIDWNEQGKMQKVRDQGQCGSCWAFTVMATIEGQITISGTTLNGWLSTQQLVDCDSSNNGCDGGWFDGAMEYFRNVGPNYESDYAYEANQSTCRNDSSKALSYRVNPLTSFKTASKAAVLITLLKLGPVSVAVDANDKFMNYSGSVFSGACSADVNHAVTLVGYGQTTNKKGKTIGYWIIRNSWSEEWGIKGHILILQKAKNNGSCNVEKYGYQPVML